MNPTLTKAAANLKRRAQKRGGKELPAAWLMTDDKRLPDPASALAALPRGSAVILRHYDAPGRAQLARKLAAACRRRGLMLLIAGDWRLAAAVGAAGVHLPEHQARRGLAPGGRLWCRARLLTAAAHGHRALRRAEALGAAAAILAPIFKTASHPGRASLGTARAAALIRTAGIPVIALGGVTAATVNGLRATGCAGIAGVGFAVS
jgi:thiamine-phosphate pyrophosphorylase